MVELLEYWVKPALTAFLLTCVIFGTVVGMSYSFNYHACLGDKDGLPTEMEGILCKIQVDGRWFKIGEYTAVRSDYENNDSEFLLEHFEKLEAESDE